MFTFKHLEYSKLYTAYTLTVNMLHHFLLHRQVVFNKLYQSSYYGIFNYNCDVYKISYKYL